MSSAHPWDWGRLDAESAAEVWADLAEWVEWLVARYDLGDEVPACWWAHPPVVEELTALWAAWLLAYQHEDSTPDRPLAWHRELDASRARIKAWDRLGCARGTHRGGGEQAWPFCREDFVDHVRADATGRPGQRRLWSV